MATPTPVDTTQMLLSTMIVLITLSLTVSTIMLVRDVMRR